MTPGTPQHGDRNTASSKSQKRKKRFSPRPHINRIDLLSKQFGLIRPWRPVTNKDLAFDTGTSVQTIRRALAAEPDPDRQVNPTLAMHLGTLLGFAPEYVALVFMRDQCRHYSVDGIRSAGKGMRPLSDITQDRKKIADQLDRVIASMNPFANSGKVKRLAFRAFRLSLGLNRAAAAKRIAKITNTKPSLAEKFLRAYEGGLAIFDDVQVATWSNALCESGANSCELLGKKLLFIHSVSDTLEVTQQWPPPASRDSGPWAGAQEKLRWYAPRGSSIALSRSPSIFGSMSIEILMATQPAACEQSPVRLLNARHDGYEVVVVLNGAIRLTIANEPFPEEAADATPLFFEGRQSVIASRIYRAGEVIHFASGLYHRCEFLDVVNRVVSVNLGGSLLLGRKL